MVRSVGEPLLDWVSHKEDDVKKGGTTATVLSDEEFIQTKGAHCNPFCDGNGRVAPTKYRCQMCKDDEMTKRAADSEVTKKAAAIDQYQRRPGNRSIELTKRYRRNSKLK